MVESGGHAVVICFDDVRNVGFFLFAAGWIVVGFANSGVIIGSVMIILGADRLIAGRLTKRIAKTDD